MSISADDSVVLRVQALYARANWVLGVLIPAYLCQLAIIGSQYFVRPDIWKPQNAELTCDSEALPWNKQCPAVNHYNWHTCNQNILVGTPAYLFCLLRKKINVATINPRRSTASAAIPTIAPTEIPPSPGEDQLGLPRKDALSLSPCVAISELGELVNVPVEPVWIGDVTIKKSSQHQACSLVFMIFKV
ncbi:hypothetical protein M422DRAFT_263643 [Sphaerobolus stellatus SS14]|uniref:Uncharacterized protein n=1 Tax=Sphaerobolus stellatus (strain SS14) TaxID=990650 RepID=A0A0C9VAG9_SPHS4|nr:hypothetical protein M422DRAFT_263643 [Sphaerobolus stellatus SS14]